MPKAEWGTKRLCPTTGKRFYDLNKTPVVSPYSGEVVPLDTGGKNRPALAEKVAKKPEKVVEPADDADEILVEADDDDDVDLADDLLDDDDDDDDTVALDDIADVAVNDDD